MMDRIGKFQKYLDFNLIRKFMPELLTDFKNVNFK